MGSKKGRFVLRTNLIVCLVRYWKLVVVYSSNWKMPLYYLSIQILMVIIGMQMLLELNLRNHIQEH